MFPHSYPLGWLLSKKKKKKEIKSVGEDVDKLESLYTIDKNVQSCSCCWKQYGGCPKN